MCDEGGQLRYRDHTAVAMASGEVCTFGKGEHGHGDTEGSPIPRVVEADVLRV
jgi:hypothetical protein